MRRPDRNSKSPNPAAGYFWAVLATGFVTAIAWPLFHGPRWPDESHPPHIGDANVLMLYLLAVLAVATRLHMGAAVLASILSVAAFDFLFVAPYLTFAVSDKQYVVTLAAMLTTAILISTLTHRVREQTAAAREAWERVETEFLRNTLLSGVSHDLRTPLAGITGATSTLLETFEDLSPQSRREMLETISGQAGRMERLVNNLLDMTRLESGGLVVKKEWHTMNEVVGAALRNLDHRLAGRTVNTNLPNDLPLLKLDGAAIEQVIVNLIDNAIEHTPSASPIDISARIVDRELLVEVADRGPGLPKGAEKRVFEKFFRAATMDTHRGIGLGLAICQGIVKSHGGQMLAANRDGGGAIFRFTLPMDDSPPIMPVDSQET